MHIVKILAAAAVVLASTGCAIHVVPVGGGVNQQYVRPAVQQQYGNSNQGQVRGHAGTVPADAYGRCPAGMVSSPRTPGQLPGCW